jgi:tetratricopeptide (TPR) repeat protein
LKEAIEDYTQTIKLDSNHAKAYNNRGYSKMQLLQLSAALEDFTKAIELDNKDPKPFSNRGYCKYMLGDDKGAFTDYLEAIKRNPIYVINLLRCLAQSISINKYFATGFVIISVPLKI